MGTMVEVYEHINDDYVTEPNLAKVSDGALHGLLESLDPDSSYLNPTEYAAYEAAAAKPPTGGIEATLAKRGGYATVVAVRVHGAAAQAGLERGDFVEGIGDQSAIEDTRDLSIEEIRQKLTGAPGSQVTLSVVHLHQSDPSKVVITRAPHSMAPLATSDDAGVGVIAVPDFAAGRADQVRAALKTMEANGTHKFVLDLRNCAAGDVAQADDVANLFLSQGTITYLEGQKYPRVTTTADAAKVADAADPLVVVTNSGTSGPAEIVAAALQQNARAKVVGDHTFGEGSVQKLIPVGDGSAVFLSVARYYTPKGALVQDGITPDVQQVEYAGALPDFDFAPEGVSPATLPDLQLQKAKEVVGSHS